MFGHMVDSAATPESGAMSRHRTEEKNGEGLVRRRVSTAAMYERSRHDLAVHV